MIKDSRLFGRFIGLPLWDVDDSDPLNLVLRFKDHDGNIIKMVIGFPMLEVRVYDPTNERVIVPKNMDCK